MNLEKKPADEEQTIPYYYIYTDVVNASQGIRAAKGYNPYTAGAV